MILISVSLIPSLFRISNAVHETAHWILTKIHGFRTDSLRKDAANNASVNGRIGPANISVSQAGQTKPDYLIAIGQRMDDAGARATDMLIGATAKVISFADGESFVFISPTTFDSVTRRGPQSGCFVMHATLLNKKGAS